MDKMTVGKIEQLSDWPRNELLPIQRLHKSLAEEINSLPERLRDYIHSLATRRDPSGEIRELVHRREQVKALEEIIVESVARQPPPIMLCAKSWVDMVREFHEKYGVPVAAGPDLIEHGDYTLRRNLHNEELLELHLAMSAVFDIYHRFELIEDLTEIADGIADLIYVLISTALTYGIPLDEIFAEVHRSNMTKDGTRRADGKILKGDKFEPPRIKEILDRYATVSATTADTTTTADHTVPE